MTIKTDDIRDFEKKYFKEILWIFNNPKSLFKKHLIELESNTIKNYSNLKQLWGKKNKIDIAVERILRFHLYRGLQVIDVYTSPLSPDVAIELKDVILCLDAKTVDLHGNSGDENTLQFQKNQVTFDGNPLSGRSSRPEVKWPGLRFPAQLEKYHNGKPCLTFFINFCYEDDGTSFRLSHVSFCSVPHGQIVQEAPYFNNLSHNYKGWSYIEDSSHGKNYKPIKESHANFSNKSMYWDPIYKQDSKTKNYYVDSYIDDSLSHPIWSGDNCLWKSPEGGSKEWKVSLWGGSARIWKDKLKSRVDGNKNPWQGVEEFKIGYGYSLSPKTKKKLSSVTIQNIKRDRYNEIQALNLLQGI